MAMLIIVWSVSLFYASLMTVCGLTHQDQQPSPVQQPLVVGSSGIPASVPIDTGMPDTTCLICTLSQSLGFSIMIVLVNHMLARGESKLREKEMNINFRNLILFTLLICSVIADGIFPFLRASAIATKGQFSYAFAIVLGIGFYLADIVWTIKYLTPKIEVILKKFCIVIILLGVSMNPQKLSLAWFALANWANLVKNVKYIVKSTNKRDSNEVFIFGFKLRNIPVLMTKIERLHINTTVTVIIVGIFLMPTTDFLVFMYYTIYIVTCFYKLLVSMGWVAGSCMYRV